MKKINTAFFIFVCFVYSVNAQQTGFTYSTTTIQVPLAGVVDASAGSQDFDPKLLLLKPSFPMPVSDIKLKKSALDQSRNNFVSNNKNQNAFQKTAEANPILNELQKIIQIKDLIICVEVRVKLEDRLVIWLTMQWEEPQSAQAQCRKAFKAREKTTSTSKQLNPPRSELITSWGIFFTKKLLYITILLSTQYICMFFCLFLFWDGFPNACRRERERERERETHR